MRFHWENLQGLGIPFLGGKDADVRAKGHQVGRQRCSPLAIF
jgi:hypothetical protein